MDDHGDIRKTKKKTKKKRKKRRAASRDVCEGARYFIFLFFFFVPSHSAPAESFAVIPVENLSREHVLKTRETREEFARLLRTSSRATKAQIYEGG